MLNNKRKIFTPREYQKLSISYLHDHDRCGLWAGMGMGKTVSVLSMLSIKERMGTLTKPVLVLAPLRVAKNVWPAEVCKWTHLSNLDVIPIVGEPKTREALLRRDAPVFSINYENIPWLVDALGDRWPFGTIVADESAKLKNFRLRGGGVRSTALSKVAHGKTKHFYNLTGTPATNGLQDLWGQTWMLDAGERLLKSYTLFKERWFKPNPYGFGIEPMPFADAQIRARIKDIHLTIDPKDYFDLKEPIVNNVIVELPDAVMSLYKQMQKKFFAEIEGTVIDANSAAAKSQKLLQISSGAIYLNSDSPSSKEWKEIHDEKIEALRRIVSEASGAPILVAYQFKFDITRLTRAFPDARVLDDKKSTEDEWNAGNIPILLVHAKSAGHGLNLQDGGNILVFFGIDWNLDDRLQLMERIGPVRQLQSGYDRPVYIYNILANTHIEELVMERINTKRSIQDILLDAMKTKNKFTME